MAFILFSSEKRKEIKAQNPEMKPKDVACLLGQMWKELSEEEKAKFKDLSAQKKAEKKMQPDEKKPKKAIKKNTEKKAKSKKDDSSDT